MSILDGLKTCRKGLHQYPDDKRTCPECRKEAKRRRYEQSPEQQKERARRWYAENHERARENMRRWGKENSEREKERKRRWKDKNPCKVRANESRRRAKKKQATPPWADHVAINAIYAEAVRLEKETGIKHHVDHIYPLQSKYLCGLHVAENLQVLPGAENIRKSNRTWPGQLDCQKD